MKAQFQGGFADLRANCSKDFLGICMKFINFKNSNCKSNEGSAKMSAAGSEGIGRKSEKQDFEPETYEGRFELSARV